MKIYASFEDGSLVVDGAVVVLASTPDLEARYKAAYRKRYAVQGTPAFVDGVVIEGDLHLAEAGDEKARAAILAMGGVELA